MKSYTITVNGNVYDVTVEEKAAGSSTSNLSKVNQPVVSKSVQPAQPSKPVSSSGEGDIAIDAKASGKVFKIEKNVGDKVKKGETVLILEIMKMETPVVAPQDGVVASVNVAVGDQVEAGKVLVTLNEE
ncbi:Biotin-requiring enzyme [Lachnospiraceae bacterium C7]|nr:Biotin-requiring enzyme [Lachnospiraceae bacterium C7]